MPAGEWENLLVYGDNLDVLRTSAMSRGVSISRRALDGVASESKVGGNVARN